MLNEMEPKCLIERRKPVINKCIYVIWKYDDVAILISYRDRKVLIGLVNSKDSAHPFFKHCCIFIRQWFTVIYSM